MGCWLLWILSVGTMIVLVLLYMSNGSGPIFNCVVKHNARCLTCPSSLSFSPPLENLLLQLASALLIFPVALDLEACNSFQKSVDRLSIVGRSHCNEPLKKLKEII